jgi:hypothetical protein
VEKCKIVYPNREKIIKFLKILEKENNNSDNHLDKDNDRNNYKDKFFCADRNYLDTFDILVNDCSNCIKSDIHIPNDYNDKDNDKDDCKDNYDIDIDIERRRGYKKSKI